MNWAVVREDGNVSLLLDIAIMGSSNPGAMLALQRIGAACDRRGLRSEILLAELGPRSTASLVPDDWPAPSTRHLSSEIDTSGLLAYPSPVAVIRSLPSLVAELTRIKPKTVLTHVDSYGIFRVLHWWAQSEGVSGYVIQEGPAVRLKRAPERLLSTVSGWERLRRLDRTLADWMMPSLFEPRTTATVADRVCVWGQAMREHLMVLGRAQKEIFITGNPGLDHLRGREPLAPMSRETVLFAHQFQPNEVAEKAFSLQLIDICANRIGCRLLFRPHPRSRLRRPDVQELTKSVTSHRERVVVADEGSLSDWLCKASVMVTLYSTSVYQAALQGVPVVLADWISPDYRLDVEAYGAGIAVERCEDFERELRRALYDECSRKALYAGGDSWLLDHVGCLDGRSAERVAEVVARAL